MTVTLLRYVPERIKQPFRNLAGLPHPFGLPLAERKRLEGMPRHKHASIRFFGRDFEICDAASFLSSHEDIFGCEIYRFEPGHAEPTVIDAGANIGLAALYLAQKWPGAKIISIEADQHIAALLGRNVKQYGLKNVQVIQGAAWRSDEILRFAPDSADAGRISDVGSLEVQGIRIRDLLEEQELDLLKLDIEGAETIVLKDCADMLHRVRRLFVEYHSVAGEAQRLATLLEVLEGSGFRYYIEGTGVHSARPLIERRVECGFDLQLNIYGIRSLDIS